MSYRNTRISCAARDDTQPDCIPLTMLFITRLRTVVSNFSLQYSLLWDTRFTMLLNKLWQMRHSYIMLHSYDNIDLTSSVPSSRSSLTWCKSDTLVSIGLRRLDRSGRLAFAFLVRNFPTRLPLVCNVGFIFLECIFWATGFSKRLLRCIVTWKTCGTWGIIRNSWKDVRVIFFFLTPPRDAWETATWSQIGVIRDNTECKCECKFYLRDARDQRVAETADCPLDHPWKTRTDVNKGRTPHADRIPGRRAACGLSCVLLGAIDAQPTGAS